MIAVTRAFCNEKWKWAGAFACPPLVHHEGPDRIAGSCDDVLPPVQHVGLRSVGDPADPRIPERLPVSRIVRHQISHSIAREQEFSRRGQESAAAAVTVITTPPGDFA